jgi:hypothetical protein
VQQQPNTALELVGIVSIMALALVGLVLVVLVVAMVGVGLAVRAVWLAAAQLYHRRRRA